MLGTNASTNGNSDGVPTVEQSVHSLITDLKSQLDRLPEDVTVVKSLVDGLFTENVVDDRK
jgi:hypothetical protein